MLLEDMDLQRGSCGFNRSDGVLIAEEASLLREGEKKASGMMREGARPTCFFWSQTRPEEFRFDIRTCCVHCVDALGVRAE